ncbi:hypothetical protein OZ664_04255 [Elizabethkingia sp. HX WHF]|uniref:Uncharacterized protein n=1 Tax=Elizabethkingia bruuniana TaxID=1756149 RepID=A0A7T7UXQ0_9FLAO|nr:MULTISPECIES: hypothetical protein [Elizabethkingia]ATL42928.1 hypothetical protein CQS02_06180 [Elizabethkingia miricola]AQX84668.1 hypothetical protein AYC65_06475 [Elizabethkingia bruuniana]KGO09869.1 hypothetical protein KS04_12435 [Elizabethkingia miricola]KUY29149.1 hypothetical protein ATB97_03195 [Elizabethkingia bruuniana]MCL1637495.1 hypothetical protein [Elizabethkingia bruuniana]
MNEHNTENNEKKRVYIPPKIEVSYIEMEYGIATGSTIQPGGTSGIQEDPWVDGGSAGTGEPEGEWWN